MAKLTYHSSGSDDDSDAGVGVGSIDGAGAGAGTGAGAGAGAGAGLFFKGQPFQALTPSKARAAVAAAGGASSSASAAGRKPLARLKTTANRAASPMEEDTISPRKRKRSEPGSHDYDSGPNSPESGSWVETDDDEMPLDLIGEGECRTETGNA
jgi:hypothetical protein